MRVGKKLGLSAVLLLVGSGFGLNRASAETVTMTLSSTTPVSPGGTISIGGSGTYGVGVLDWTLNTDDTPTGGALSNDVGNSVYTYCIDTSHDINPGGQYIYSVYNNPNTTTLANELNAANPNNPQYSGASIQAIENLYSLYSLQASLNPGNASSDLNAGGANLDAAQFQAALWDIIDATNGASSITSGGVVTTSGANALSGISVGSLTTAGQWAYAAYNDPHPYTGQDFTALVGAQNQAIMFAGPDFENPVPLPPVAGTSMMLLAGVGIFYFGRRRLARVA